MKTILMILVLAVSAFPMIAGKVSNEYGRGMSRVAVTISSCGEQVTTLTSPFGYYFVDGPVCSGAYIVPQSKRFQFEPSVRIVLGEPQALFGMNFVALSK